MGLLWAFATLHRMPVRRFSIWINDLAAQTGTLAPSRVRTPVATPIKPRRRVAMTGAGRPEGTQSSTPLVSIPSGP